MAFPRFLPVTALHIVLLALVCGMVWGLSASPVLAQAAITQPSVEVNLEVLRGLKAAPTAPAPYYAPPAVAAPVVERAVPVENAPLVPVQPFAQPESAPTPVAAPGIPAALPETGQQPKAKTRARREVKVKPVAVIAAPVAPAPIPVAQPIATPAPAPIVKAPVPAPIPTPVPIAPPAPVAAPAPAVKAPSVAPIPAPQPVAPAPIPVAQPIATPVPALPIASNPKNWQNTPLPTVIPSTQLPAVSAQTTLGTAQQLQPRPGDLPPLPAAVLPPVNTPNTVQPTIPALPSPGALLAPTNVQPLPEKPVTKDSKPVVVSSQKPERKGESKTSTTDFEKALTPQKPTSAISSAPILVPVPEVTPPPPVLPPSVTKRLEKTFAAEPAKQGIIKDEKKIANAPNKPALPVPTGIAQPTQLLSPAPVLKQETVVTEKLPPAELPAPVTLLASPTLLSPKAEIKPIILPKTEIASLPKLAVATGDSVPVAVLPKPPSAAEVAKTAALSSAKPVLPTLPKLPGENTLSVPPKLPLPALTAITGDAPPSTADILQPKDAISAAPLAPALPALPVPGGVKVATVPALPDPEVLTKLAKNEVATAAAPALIFPVPSIAPVAISAGSGDKPTHSVTYAKNKVDLLDSAKAELSELAETLKKTQGNVRVVAYAAGTAEEASVAKKTSYARALQIRAFLIEKGVNKLNVNVQALGNAATGSNADRADIFLK